MFVCVREREERERCLLNFLSSNIKGSVRFSPLERSSGGEKRVKGEEKAKILRVTIKKF